MSASDPDFAPANPTDGRQSLDWKSKYTDLAARRGIRFEACYLAALFFGAPLLILVLWLEYPKDWLCLTDEKYRTLFRYGLAWFSGLLGGTMFGIKWLYHVVAKQLWHLDRRLWRVFTPHISAGLACVFVGLISSGLLQVLDSRATESRPLVFGLAFLVGYFSDSTSAKLAEVAVTLFGMARIGEKKDGSSSAPGTGG